MAQENNDIVKLKPIMGVKPGVYLTGLYLLIIFIILFIVFVHHGLVNYGTILIVTTEPAGAAVRVNGGYLGTSGTKIPMPNSIKPNETVNIQVVLPGFESEGGDYPVPGRVFGTRFFPRTFKLEYTLKTNNPMGVLANAASEYAAWTFGGEPTEAWQVPLVLSEGAYRVGTVNNEILKAAARFTTTRAALRDIVRAKTFLDNGGQAPSPAALTNSISDMLVFLSENPGTASWLAGLLPAESAAVVRESNWYKNESLPPVALPELETGTARQVSVSGLLFREISSGLMISDTPVSKTLFETFLTENPEWQNHYIDYFEDDPGHPTQVYGNDIVTGISWYAADAFCKWMTQRLPASMSNMEVLLPSQADLEFAEYKGLFAVQGQVGWEWCYDPFAPLNFTASPDAIQAVGSPERTLYGRQTPNSRLVRASLPPDFRSPIVTFRPLIGSRE